MGENFTARYEVDDGYVGGARTQRFVIRPNELDVEQSTTDQQLAELFHDLVEQDMRERISSCNLNVDEFIKWVRSQIESDAP